MTKNKKYSILSGVFLALSVFFVAFSLSVRSLEGTADVSRRVEKHLAARLKVLQSFTDKALAAKAQEWSETLPLPSDMVIYCYVDGVLHSWHNRFPVSNDQLDNGVLFQSLVNPRSGLRSALSTVGEQYRFCNIGPKWYIARTITQDNVKLIVGLEVTNSRDDRSFSGINPLLHVPDNCSVMELSNSGGTPVSFNGTPMFKILSAATYASSTLSMPYIWFALVLFIVAALLFLLSNPSRKHLLIELVAVISVILIFYLSGSRVNISAGLFSPLLYADGVVFYSLGALILLSLLLIIPIWSIFIARKSLRPLLNRSVFCIIQGLLLATLAVVVVAFTYFVIKSITLNSNINLEIYKVKEFTAVSALVYVLLCMLLSCLGVLMHLLQPICSHLFGFHANSHSIPGRIAFSFLFALYLVSITASLGFKKEQDRMEVWANRLAVSRDIALEMRLRRVEDQIASDPVIASLSVLQNASSAIRNRIADTYLNRLSGEYDLLVSVGGAIDLSSFNEAEYISPGSRFVFKEGTDALLLYSAIFSYYIPNHGPTNILIRLDRKGDWRYRGYASIFGETAPGEVLIPSTYAYARYNGNTLLSFRGNYAYPVHMDELLEDAVYNKGVSHLQKSGFTHFIYQVAPNESVIVSRRSIAALYYGASGIFLGLIAFLAQSFFHRRRKESILGKNYFSTRLNWVIMLSLSLTLVAMVTVSVYFVYNRNEENRRTLMTEKINSISASITTRIRGAKSTDDLRSADLLSLIKDIGTNTNSDITLYTPEGKVFMSTAPMYFERSMVDSRINVEAYRHIMLLTSRYYVQKETIGRKHFYCMYAPLVGESGNIIAIICTPYTDDHYDFETNAANHAISILSVFIFLLLIASFMTRRVLDGMFRPLLAMGKKMEGANLDSLEYISYDKSDEITSLVNAYNRFVSELSLSSHRLAQAERDKAWSGMARQVAHEIKNPLTPMKLQIQRLMRLKAKGDPAWQDKFEEVSKVLLDHIEILTDTANEFSTFAKLYTEEPSEINLGKLLQEEIAMFSGREDISFEYIGMDDAIVMGPKPQLVRVFVNLINNAVQALDGQADGKVYVSLRGSIKEGYYDIVFEDNGPGVLESNTDKLFTPNFTTKTGGSGLGLAISRSILQKCGASITYSKSISLNGACFTILYPKNE